MNLPEDEVLYAGAYRVCFERFDPDNCVTATHLEGVDAKAVKIAAWTDTQSPEVKTAYLRAIQEVRKRAADRLENQQRAVACLSAYDSIPKPPEK
jgi:hypothetical protein